MSEIRFRISEETRMQLSDAASERDMEAEELASLIIEEYLDARA